MKRAFLFLALALIAFSACNLPQAAPPAPSPTAPPPSVSPTLTPIPPSATPVQLLARIRAEKVNCRFGPGVAYESLNELEEGQIARVIGRNADSTWWQARDPGDPGGRCWLAAQVTELQGEASALPVVPPPPITVKKIALRIEPRKIFVACDQFPQTVFFEAQISTNGPAPVLWRLESSSAYVSAENLLIFEEAGNKTINGYYQVNSPGDYWIRLHVLKPNDAAERLSFPANCAP